MTTDPTNPDGTPIDAPAAPADPTVTEPSATSTESVAPAETTPPVAPEEPAPAPEEPPAEPEVVNTVTPPANPDVVPAASETPVAPAGPGSATATGLLIPTSGSFGSPEEIAAAQAAGLPTPQGNPLNPFERDILRGVETALAGIESWIAHIRRQVAKLPPA